MFGPNGSIYIAFAIIHLDGQIFKKILQTGCARQIYFNPIYCTQLGWNFSLGFDNQFTEIVRILYFLWSDDITTIYDLWASINIRR